MTSPILQRVRRQLMDPAHPTSLAARARVARFEQLLARFPDLATMRVLDLGGRPRTWLQNEPRPRQVVCLNLPAGATATDVPVPADAPFFVVEGDACDPPERLRTETFDLVFSNSVIEHVGGHARRRLFADAVRRFAPHHWVQTPNRYFPLEPHWVFPFFQFLPPRTRAAVSRTWPLGFEAARGESKEESLATALGVELIGAAEMRLLFPDSVLLRERSFGLAKSLIAVR